MIAKKKVINHIICVLITLGFLACAVFMFPHALGRVIEGVRDLALSLAYFFCKMFGIEKNIQPTVLNLPKKPFFDFIKKPSPTFSFPTSWVDFKLKWVLYWKSFATGSTFLSYFSLLSDALYYFAFALLIIVPFLIFLRVMLRRYVKKQNNDCDKDSKPLKVFKAITKTTFLPFINMVAGLYLFIKQNRKYLKIWLCIWLFNFNVYTIFLEFIAFYFYFVLTFDFSTLYLQLYKLVLDITPALTFVPLWVWGLVFFYYFNKLRKKIAFSRLNHNEMKNRGFVSALPVATLIVGPMGQKKTMLMSDMALSAEVNFRYEAFKGLMDYDLKFPNFPWSNLWFVLKQAMKDKKIYNLATCRKFIQKERGYFESCDISSNIFGYDFERYGLEYDNNLKIVEIWDVIETYAQLFFFYIIQSSLLISNYSIRADNVLMDIGNFPLWNSDFFKRDNRLMSIYSRYSHILDFDMLRLGQRVVEDNKYRNAFDFGIVVITEIGKERGNNLENKETKKQDNEANQKNDFFDTHLKLIRHKSTINYYPFVKFLTDEQRPESWGANARDLATVIWIEDSNDLKLALPLYSFMELIHSFFYDKFIGFYTKYIFNRADNTLLMYLLKKVISKLHKSYENTYNLFSYWNLDIRLESGRLKGDCQKAKYFLMKKKILADRYSTDCYSEFFDYKALLSRFGVNDLPEYAGLKATPKEFDSQHSYFYRDLTAADID